MCSFMSKVDFAERAYKEIQIHCKKNGYVFFVDMTKEEFLDEAYDYIMHFPGWLIPISMEQDFLKGRRSELIGENWDRFHLILHAFNAFEDGRKWHFSIEKDNETKAIKPECV